MVMQVGGQGCGGKGEAGARMEMEWGEGGIAGVLAHGSVCAGRQGWGRVRGRGIRVRGGGQPLVLKPPGTPRRSNGHGLRPLSLCTPPPSPPPAFAIFIIPPPSPPPALAI